MPAPSPQPAINPARVDRWPWTIGNFYSSMRTTRIVRWKNRYLRRESLAPIKGCLSSFVMHGLKPDREKILDFADEPGLQDEPLETWDSELQKSARVRNAARAPDRRRLRNVSPGNT
jgi:hypothetical protein